MWSYFKVECKQFFMDKKNLSIYILLAFVAIFYAFKIAPAYDPIEKADYDEIEARYLTRQEFLDNVDVEDLHNSHPSVSYAYYIYSEVNPRDKMRLDALDNGDLQKYAEVTSEWYILTNAFTYKNESISYNARYFTENNRFANDDAFFAYLDQYVRYDAYAKAEYELSMEAFEQRTALQTLERLVKENLPILLIVCALLLSIDIVTKDRRHPTVLKGFPISDWKRLLVKMVVSLIGSIALFIPLFIGFIIIGMQFGFGHFQLPSPVYAPHLNWMQDGKFEMMTLGAFLGQSVALILVWFIVVINAVLLCSVLFRQEMVNFAVVLLLLFGEKFYASRGVGYFWDIHNYPTSYIEVGKIVSKYQNYYYTSDQLDFRLGLLLLVGLAVILLILTLIVAVNKRFKLVK
ncbi:ABC transporter permease [Lysinibacillus sp. 2017]|uniref:ABC transporter permease n=1 Tax=unclassified Lysinibacillus TaxID=2636778 RepID=UPI000D528106|nr:MULTISPECIES: ABC transporter permease [unclassified Lysinibacillus]AWE06899.1 ABC transporter permease [Lysinibacillus sp. 2017]TGN37170.1 ABC transporter permease [Lysinibacillus sp. S2017]